MRLLCALCTVLILTGAAEAQQWGDVNLTNPPGFAPFSLDGQPVSSVNPDVLAMACNQSQTVCGTTGINVQNFAEKSWVDSQFSALQSSQSSLQSAVNLNTANIATLQLSVSNNTTGITALQNAVSANTTNVLSLQTATNNNSASIATLQVAVNTNANDVGNLQNLVSINTTDISVNSASINSINTTFTSLADAKYVKVNSVKAAPTATGTDAIAIGDGASASSTAGVAVGHNASSAGSGATAVGANANATAANAVALGAGSVADEADTVSVGAQGNERRITNVAAGSNSNDAVNVGQLQAGLNQALSQANAYTDKQIAGVRDFLNRRANGGTAAAMAVSAIPQMQDESKTVLIGVGFGNWRGSNGMAFGASAIVARQAMIKAAATFDDQGGKGFSAGVGFQF